MCNDLNYESNIPSKWNSWGWHPGAQNSYPILCFPFNASHALCGHHKLSMWPWLWRFKYFTVVGVSLAASRTYMGEPTVKGSSSPGLISSHLMQCCDHLEGRCKKSSIVFYSGGHVSMSGLPPPTWKANYGKIFVTIFTWSQHWRSGNGVHI